MTLSVIAGPVGAPLAAPGAGAVRRGGPAGAGAPAGSGAPTGSRDLPEVRTSPLPADTLLRLSHSGLVEAAAATRPGERYAAAHLAALRAAAAVLACRARPASGGGGRRSRPMSAWVLLSAVAPELAEWADFFAAGARKRAAAEAGVPASVTAREADDLLRDAQTFLSVVETDLGFAPRLPAA